SVHTLTDHGAEGADTILNSGGLAVGGADLRVLDTYTAAHIIAAHGMLSRDDIIAAIRYAAANRDYS
ncbi:MAG: hypothetical protein M3N14_12360, partial [Bacteroidota bacterium]|nr:hypothetical protein [Bacteroidota bacterium]